MGWRQSLKRYSSSEPPVPPNRDATRPTHVSVRNPPQPGCTRSGRGGRRCTHTPTPGEPHRPTHAPFLLGLACLGSHGLATPAPKIGGPARRGVRPGGEGRGRSPQSGCPLLKGPQTSGRAGGEHFGPPGPELDCARPQRSPLPAPPHPYPPQPAAVTGAGAGGGPGGGPQPRPPWPARLTLSAQMEEPQEMRRDGWRRAALAAGREDGTTDTHTCPHARTHARASGPPPRASAPRWEGGCQWFSVRSLRMGPSRGLRSPRLSAWEPTDP